MKSAKQSLTCLLLCLAAAGTAYPQALLRSKSYELKIFDTPVVVNKYVGVRTPDHTLKFVSLHHDEQTGLKVAKEVIGQRGGELFELVSNRNGQPARHLYFKYNNHEYRIDPNRFFTSAGVTKDVRRRNCFDVVTEGERRESACDWGRPVFEDFFVLVPEVLRFSRELLEMIKPAEKGALVSVHNNSDRGFSLGSYTHGGQEWRSSEKGLFFGKEDLDNFFLVTNEALFRKLLGHKPETWDFNIALQKKPPNPDDGSLSIYSGRHGWNYILVEAETNSGAERQRQMIERLVDVYELTGDE
ncbi:MAG: hypothetical protein OEQ28_06870 [Acidobacteriota bacterium]|nr:hypothetical protein [Acidobacteriota bacterium]